MISVVRRRGVVYPPGTDGYSPHERYPEYPFDAISSVENPVYEMVRTLFRQLGLDAEHEGARAWNPLGSFIPLGSRVFVLCNFVYHRRPQETEHDFHAKIAQGSVLRALIDYVLLATGETGKVLFGNAPLQSCRWDQVLAQTGAGDVLAFYRRAGAPVEAIDLRAEVVERDSVGRVVRRESHAGATPTVEIDLGSASLLDGIDRGAARPPRFRVSDYDPDRTEGFHARGSHRYVMHRAILDSDVVISLPKLKTHEKVGITCAIKGFVGTIARKDCLAHHRFGSPGRGGDEYPAGLGFLYPLSVYHDWVNRRPQGALAQSAAQALDVTLRRMLRRLGVDGAGAWHGNDTAWRMALDLARIVHYADVNGTMHATPRRRHLVLVDGIVAGEGAGPLAPSPVDAGILLFADNVVDADRAACRLMGFDPESIAMVREAARASAWPLDRGAAPPARTVVDGESIRAEDVPAAIGRPFRPPRGWKGHLG